MSASLVGSEMCIRDRRRRSCTTRSRWCLRATTFVFLARWQRMRAAWLLVRPPVFRRRVPVREKASLLHPDQSRM
eukprot:2234784-Alexandrium_andersonii.AAC.1